MSRLIDLSPIQTRRLRHRQETVPHLRKEKGCHNVDHGWPGRKLVSDIDWRVSREVIEEKQRMLRNYSGALWSDDWLEHFQLSVVIEGQIGPNASPR
jgi:hypothetical protein